MDLFSKEDSAGRAVACSECFNDQGLHLDAEKIGCDKGEIWPNCGSKTGKKLTLVQLDRLAYRFFVLGSVAKWEYCASPVIEYNQSKETSIDLNGNLGKDVKIFEEILGVGFFNYGPRAWMYGEIEPLKELLDKDKRCNIIKRILTEYPKITISSNDSPFYRIRNGKTLHLPKNNSIVHQINFWEGDGWIMLVTLYSMLHQIWNYVYMKYEQR